jgi:hypothetical protein
LANSLEKISYRIGMCRSFIQKKEGDHYQGNPARKSEAIHQVIGVQSQAGIFCYDCALREEDFSCTSGIKVRSVVIFRSRKQRWPKKAATAAC